VVFNYYNYEPPRKYAFVLFGLYAVFLFSSLSSEAGA